MKKGNKTDILTSVDIQEIVIFDGKINETDEKIIYKENVKKSLFENFVGELFKVG